MSQENAVPDPRAQYERAADQMAALIDAVRPDRLGAPTPYAEFDVRALLGHVVRGTHGAAELGATAAGAGAAGAPAGLSAGPSEGPDATADVPDDGWATAYARARAELVAAWADDAALVAPVRMP